jgi:hypothetical protein
MKRFLAALGFAVVALGLFALTDTASATNGVLDDFTTAYPATAGTSLDSCSTCHTSVPALNAYGSAVKASGMNFAGIEDLDSDGDGFTNRQEIRNLTNPGNAADRPATTTTTTSTTSTTSTTAATSPQSVATTPAPAPNVAVAPAGALAFDAGVAGKVWLSVGTGVLIVERVDTTWDFKIEMDDDGEIEIKFRKGGQEIEFEAELEDGTIKTELEIEFDDHGDHDDDDHNSDDDDHGDEDDDYVGRDHDDDHESDDDDD